MLPSSAEREPANLLTATEAVHLLQSTKVELEGGQATSDPRVMCEKDAYTPITTLTLDIGSNSDNPNVWAGKILTRDPRISEYVPVLKIDL